LEESDIDAARSLLISPVWIASNLQLSAGADHPPPQLVDRAHHRVRNRGPQGSRAGASRERIRVRFFNRTRLSGIAASATSGVSDRLPRTPVGAYRFDLLVEGSVLVEGKSAEKFERSASRCSSDLVLIDRPLCVLCALRVSVVGVRDQTAAPISSANLLRSMLPPETIATSGP